MNQFVIAGNIEGGVSLSEDRVAQGKRQRELPAGKPMQKPLHAAAVELDDAATNAGVAPGAEADYSREAGRAACTGKPRAWREGEGACWPVRLTVSCEDRRNLIYLFGRCDSFIDSQEREERQGFFNLRRRKCLMVSVQEVVS